MHLTTVHHDHVARLGVDTPGAAPGAPVAGGEREWRMLYFDPLLATQIASNEGVDTVEMVRPAVRDRALPPLFARLFACITAPAAHPFSKHRGGAPPLGIIVCGRSKSGWLSQTGLIIR